MVNINLQQWKKLDSICQSYAQMKKGPVFWLTVYIRLCSGNGYNHIWYNKIICDCIILFLHDTNTITGKCHCYYLASLTAGEVLF